MVTLHAGQIFLVLLPHCAGSKNVVNIKTTAVIFYALFFGKFVAEWLEKLLNNGKTSLNWQRCRHKS